jgi:endonuclease G
MKTLLTALFFLLTPVAVYASPCDQFFPNGKEIVVKDTKVLCNSFYVIVYDEKNEANVFSSEIVQKHTSKVERTNDFRPDPRVAHPATPADYTNTGYDRGHMVAAANSSSTTQMSDTFLMTNMTPQLPSVNRVAWRILEDKVRAMPFTYIVTGAIYSPSSPVIGTHNVRVPTNLWKVVFLSDGTTKAYIVDNVKGAAIVETTVEVVEAKVGFKIR